jgi:Tol biopolymer transport system component
MLDKATGELTQLTYGNTDTRPSWSPDGTTIIFGRATTDTNRNGYVTVSDFADIYVLDIASGEEKNLTNTPEVGEFNFAWSPNGKWIAYTGIRRDVNGDGSINLDDSEDLFMIPSGGGDEQFLNLRGRAVFSPSWSPDGRFILVLVMDDEGQTTIWRYDNWTEDFIRITEAGPYYHPRYSNTP